MKEKTDHEFIQHINEIYKKCVGNETYGNNVEFFDEDGVVLMCASVSEDGKGIEFTFSESAESFTFKSIEDLENSELKSII